MEQLEERVRHLEDLLARFREKLYLHEALCNCDARGAMDYRVRFKMIDPVTLVDRTVTTQLLSYRHQSMVVSYDGGETYLPQPLCAESWCHGDCGFPALAMKLSDPHSGERELKAHGVMVACGSVFQEFRVGWNGEKIYLPTDAPKEALRNLMWW